MKKFLSLKKVRAYLFLSLGLCFLLFSFSVSYPMAQKTNTTRVTGEAARLISTTLAGSISHYSIEDLKYLRTHMDVATPAYKSINGLLTETVDSLHCTRIFAVYKGVGGKYYYLLDSRYRDNTSPTTYAGAGEPMDGDYLRHKSILDKISSKTLVNEYGNTIIPTPFGSAVMAWSAITDTNGEVAAILGVQCDPGNTAFSQFGFLNLTFVALISFFCFVVLGGLLYYTFTHPYQSTADTFKEERTSTSLGELRSKFLQDETSPPEEEEDSQNPPTQP